MDAPEEVAQKRPRRRRTGESVDGAAKPGGESGVVKAVASQAREAGAPEPAPVASRRRKPETRVRDLDRIREKVTLSLEPSQLLLCGVALLAALALAFVAGLMVGRAGGPPRSPDPLAAEVEPPLSASAEPVPRLGPSRGSDSRGSRADGPVRTAVLPLPPLPPPEPRGIDGQAVATTRVRKAAWLPPLPGRGAEVVAVASTVRKGPDPVPEPPPPEPPWPSMAVTDAGACKSCILPEGCPDPRPALVSAVAAGPAPAPEATRAAVPGTGAFIPRPEVAAVSPVRPAVGQGQKEEVAPSPRRAAAQKAAVQARFEVQVRSYRSEEEARAYARELAARGYDTRVVRYDDASGVAWYRVRLGRFASADKAKEFVSRLNEKESTRAIPVEVR